MTTVPLHHIPVARMRSMLAAGALFALVALAWLVRTNSHSLEAARLATMRADLAALAQAEQAWFDHHQAFTADLSALTFEPTELVHVNVVSASPAELKATARHQRLRDACTVVVRRDKAAPAISCSR